MRNILIFYNPYSGRKTKTNHLRMLTGEIEKLGDCFEVISQDPNTLSNLPDPNGQPADLVIVFGGDGTIRAVAQLILESGSRAPVAVSVKSNSGGCGSDSILIWRVYPEMQGFSIQSANQHRDDWPAKIACDPVRASTSDSHQAD